MAVATPDESSIKESPEGAGVAASQASGLGRLRSLDGLRGIAALAVVVTHAAAIASPYTMPHSSSTAVDRWSTEIQRILLDAGTQSVYIFFILSGIVITLPVLRGEKYDWFAYFPRRLLRLYLPVLASLLLSVVLIFAVPRHAAAAVPGSWLAVSNATSTDPLELPSEATLQVGTYLYNGPLWSLTWEVLFSLQLPLFVVVAVLARRYWIIAVCTCLLLILFGNYSGLVIFQMMPMFLIGAIIAVHLDEIRTVAERLYERPWAWLITVVALVAVGLAFSSREVLPASVMSHKIAFCITGTAWSAAAALVILLALESKNCRRLLEATVPKWLGRVSFSLYLVHLPILVTLAYGLGEARWPLAIGIGIPVALVAAWLFARFVEGPSHRLSRAVGSRSSRAAARFWAARTSLS